jgi:hypothetical protein
MFLEIFVKVVYQELYQGYEKKLVFVQFAKEM